jgi:beta-phosphoglucomutase
MKVLNADIQAAIFDLDGVIVDTAKYHYLAWKRLANEVGIDLSIEENERLKGVSRMDSLDIILALGNVTLDKAKKEELAEKKNGWFLEFVNQMTPAEMLPGAQELLIDLRSKGLKIALGSSSKNAPLVLRLLNIQNLFDVVVDGTMVKNSKPDPEVFLLGAELLSLSPAACVVFEDAEAGVEAALAAGMKCVGIGSPAQLGKAHQVVINLINFSFQSSPIKINS